MFVPEIELGEPKYRVLCKFSIKSTIYNVQLPEMIKNRLASINMTPDPSKFYLIDISFSVAAYRCKKFYKFPVKYRPRCLEKPKQRSGQEKVGAYINEVLTQQLKSICRVLSGCGIRYRYAVIAGEAFKDARHVVFRIYEDAATTALVAEQTDRRKRAEPKAYAVFSHRPSIINKLAKHVANSSDIFHSKGFISGPDRDRP